MASSPTRHHSANFLFTTQPPSYSYGGSKQHEGGSERAHNIGVLVLSFFSMALFLTVLYCLYIRWSSLSVTSRAAAAAATTEEEEAGRDGFGVGYGGLFQSGLNKKIIAGLQERPHEGASEDCAICLSKMVVGELVKIMPVCEHGFHSQCVEEWLKAQATCPMCRTFLIAVPTKPKSPVDPLDMA